MIRIEKLDGESRDNYLIRLAIVFIRNQSGYIGADDTLFYDDAECDGYCLADDLMAEFGIDEFDLD